MKTISRRSLDYWPVAAVVAALALLGTLLPDAPDVRQTRVPATAPADTSTLEITDQEQERAGGASADPAASVLEGPAGATDAQALEMVANCDPATGRLRMPTFDAPFCVPAFSGDNGGVTHQGVTEDEILIAVYVAPPNPAVDVILQNAGLADTPDQFLATVEDFIDLFEAHLETYGRSVRLVNVDGSGDHEDDQAARADAIRIATQIGAFASFSDPGNSTPYVNELVSRGVMCFCTNQLPNRYYQDWAPYVWSGLPNYDQIGVHMSEYIGKRLAGRPARWAGDPQLRSQTRKFGLITFNTVRNEFEEGARFLGEEMGRWGVPLDQVVSFTPDLARAQEQSRTMLARLKADGITSVILFADPVFPIFITQEATRQRYFPEWLITGSALTDTNFFGRIYDQAQWSHAFGISALPARTPVELTDSWRLHEWHFGRPPTARNTQALIFGLLVPIFYGIHYAGPNLTPFTFRDGWFSQPPTTQPAGPTRVAVGFTRGVYPWDNYQGIADFTEIWWDPSAPGTDEAGNDGRGMYRFVAGGRRYLPGQWPSSEPSAFNPEGTVVQYTELPPSDIPPSYPPPR